MITADEVRRLIIDHDAARPRSQQTAIGPSVLGSPCARKLVYQLAGVPKVVPDQVNLAAWVGTQMHSGMERTVKGNDDWITEQKVSAEVAPGITLFGTFDAYHRPSFSVIDWKSVGPSALAKYRRASPDIYLTQTAVYGLLAVLNGFRVDHTVLVYIPRNGDLNDIHVDSRRWDYERAEQAVKRLEHLHAVAAAGPAVLPLVPVADDCRFCSWWKPGSEDIPTGCPGANPKDLSADLPPWEMKTAEAQAEARVKEARP